MLGYYDSDEDVYWGPVTLKESKQDILRKVAPDSIKNRRTISCDPSFINDQPRRYEEIISSKNQFFDIPSNMSDPQNFIEKVAEVLEVTAPSDETSYFTAKDSAKAIDTSAAYFTSSDDTKGNRYEIEKYKNNDSVDSSISVDGVVNISSDIDDSILDHSLNLKDSLMKKEVFSEESMDKINTHDSSTKDDEIGGNDKSKTKLDLNFIMDLSHDSDKPNVSTSSEESSNELYEFAISPIGKPHNNLEIIEEVDENTAQIDLIPKIEIISSSRQCKSLNDTEASDHEESSNDESFKFNDTMEEVERLLRGSLNCTMTSSESTDKLHKKEEVSAIPASNCVGKNISRSNHLTETRIPNSLTVKLPAKQHPQKSPIRTPTPLRKPLGKDRFKNIQSPVATYIKNSGKAPLLKTVTPSKLSNKENNHNLGVTVKKASADNLSTFPEVRYKTPKKQIIQTEDFKLPQSISTLIPLKANVAHHRKRNDTKQLSKELVDGDLTIGTDSSLNSTQDVSILDRRNVFI